MSKQTNEQLEAENAALKEKLARAEGHREGVAEASAAAQGVDALDRHIRQVYSTNIFDPRWSEISGSQPKATGFWALVSIAAPVGLVAEVSRNSRGELVYVRPASLEPWEPIKWPLTWYNVVPGHWVEPTTFSHELRKSIRGRIPDLQVVESMHAKILRCDVDPSTLVDEPTLASNWGKHSHLYHEMLAKFLAPIRSIWGRAVDAPELSGVLKFSCEVHPGQPLPSDFLDHFERRAEPTSIYELPYRPPPPRESPAFKPAAPPASHTGPGRY